MFEMRPMSRGESLKFEVIWTTVNSGHRTVHNEMRGGQSKFYSSIKLINCYIVCDVIEP